MPFGSFTAGRHVSFSDTTLGIAGQVQEVKDLEGANITFTPQGVFVNSSSDETEELAGIATIRGWLAGENASMVDDYIVYTKTPVGLAFAAILSTGTTARGIKSVSGI